jgi:hypothetical protein
MPHEKCRKVPPTPPDNIGGQRNQMLGSNIAKPRGDEPRKLRTEEIKYGGYANDPMKPLPASKEIPGGKRSIIPGAGQRAVFNWPDSQVKFSDSPPSAPAKSLVQENLAAYNRFESPADPGQDIETSGSSFGTKVGIFAMVLGISVVAIWLFSASGQNEASAVIPTPIPIINCVTITGNQVVGNRIDALKRLQPGVGYDFGSGWEKADENYDWAYQVNGGPWFKPWGSNVVDPSVFAPVEELDVVCQQQVPIEK